MRLWLSGNQYEQWLGKVGGVQQVEGAGQSLAHLLCYSGSQSRKQRFTSHRVPQSWHY